MRQQSKQLLEQVCLTGAGRLRSGSYSGGMKRRLSVACALLGDPHIVFLDEPTTGMDPISRRHVWDIIETAKAGQSLLLLRAAEHSLHLRWATSYLSDVHKAICAVHASLLYGPQQNQYSPICRLLCVQAEHGS